MTPSQTAEATASLSAQPFATGCVEQFGIFDKDETIEATAFYAETVVVGRITTVEESRWTTPADYPPGSSSGAPEYIYTPLTLEVEAPVRGGIVGSSVDVRVGGGTVGAGTAACTRLTISGVPSDFEIGQRYAIFLVDPDLVPEGHGLVGIWPVVRGVVHTPRDGEMSIDELRDQLTAFPNGEFPFGPFPSASP